MAKLSSHFQLNLDGTCNPKCVVQGAKYRFTILTPQMLRLEYSEDGIFEDRPTQTVWNRNFDEPEFSVTDRHDRLEISTSAFHLVYNKKEFTPNNLYIDIKYSFTNYGGRWLFGATEYGNPPREHNLKGTACTLDRIDGETELEFGLCDWSGRAFFDDSESLVLDGEGWVHPRDKGVIDCYFLAYGRDYYGAIRDFYKLSGPAPLLPKYALGNWWSRYYPYSEDSYMELLERFRSEDIPFSIAVMDMDWHIVDVPDQYGRGWTGYTWNRELFPDPQRFLTWLHDNNLKASLNLHPADGVQGFEEMYEEMARHLGVDYEKEDPINFNITDTEFLDAYFRYLHHPNEEMGVDFWWMDWQQGKISAVEGLDPLWMLNHYHYYDITRTGKRGMLLSRYSGLGSHRYPVGFSGDTVTTWDSLRFQPYFTATAANAGYTWWSHDIGGHMRGIRDRQLFVRWVQLGVFSPINRLHSNSNPFCGKEPWLYGKEAGDILRETLRLRHQLIPYLYAMNNRCHTELIPVITPVYYGYPLDEALYDSRYRNQYLFGSELMVCPMTSPTHHSTNMTSQEVWLPQGTWTDFFTGKTYSGGKKTVLNRSLEHQGVLAKAGAIVPLAEHVPHSNATDNPEGLQILIFPGASRRFSLYEDEGEGFAHLNGKYAVTDMRLEWQDGRAEFVLQPAGDLSVLPQKRRYTLCFRGFNNLEDISTSSPCQKSYCAETRTLTLAFEPMETSALLSVNLEGDLLYSNNDLPQRIFDFLNQCQIALDVKDDVYKCCRSLSEPGAMAAHINALKLEQPLTDALLELILA